MACEIKGSYLATAGLDGLVNDEEEEEEEENDEMAGEHLGLEDIQEAVVLLSASSLLNDDVTDTPTHPLHLPVHLTSLSVGSSLS
eukprot:151631-Hanusia_phi.AAC.1